MSVQRIAELIPAEYRKEILELNMIETAIPRHDNSTMYYLGVIWKQYVEPNFEPDCNLCYARVLENFRNIKPFLVHLERESKLLDSV